MKNKYVNLFITICIFLSGSLITTQKSNAIVSYYFKKMSIRTIAVIASGTGGVTYGTAITISGIYGGPSVIVAGQMFIPLIIAPIIAGLGLVMLDDQTVNTINFLPITNDQYTQYSPAEIQSYNQELEELNAIKDTIELESRNQDESYIKQLWIEYSKNLSESTLKIASDQANRLLYKVR